MQYSGSLVPGVNGFFLRFYQLPAAQGLTVSGVKEVSFLTGKKSWSVLLSIASRGSLRSLHRHDFHSTHFRSLASLTKIMIGMFRPPNPEKARVRLASSSACLRSVMSSEMPTRYCGLPSASRIGTLRVWQDPDPFVPGMHEFFRRVHQLAASQGLAIPAGEEISLLKRKDIIVSLSDQLLWG